MSFNIGSAPRVYLRVNGFRCDSKTEALGGMLAPMCTGASGVRPHRTCGNLFEKWNEPLKRPFKEFEY